MSDDDLLRLAMSANWCAWEIDAFRRANGHCEYCNKDLTSSADAFYFDRHFDHIRPDDGNGIENMAVACKACNFIKRDRVFEGTSRTERIAAAATFINSVRERNKRRLAIDLAWFRTNVPGRRK